MKKALLLSVSISFLLWGVKQSSACLFSQEKYYFMHNGLLSQDHFFMIKDRIEQLYSNNTSGKLIATIKKEFPLLDKITIAYRPSGAYVMLYADKPCCCINDELVLTHKNEIFPLSFFSASFLTDLAHITVDHESVSEIIPLVSSLLHELPADFYHTYDLELVHEHCVRLLNKQEKNFTIILSAQQKNITSLLAHCCAVKNNIAERKAFEKGITWAADTRFSDYIVAYRV